MPAQALFLLLLLQLPGQRSQSELELLRPENNVSSRPVLEFRARKNIHAFVAVGRQLDNGLVYYDGIAGFYPAKGTGAYQIAKNVLYSKGRTSYEISDLRIDESYFIPISEDQYEKVRFVMSQWDSKEDYAILTNNCVDMMKDVASVLGLKHGGDLTPLQLVQSLRKLNARDQAMRSDALERERQEAARELNQAMDAAIAGKIRDIERRKAEYNRKVEVINRMREGLQTGPTASTAPPSKTTARPPVHRPTPARPRPPSPPPSPPRPTLCTPATCPNVYIKPPDLS